MNRYLLVLATVAMLAVAAVAVLGLSLGDVSDPHDRTAQQWARVHRLGGVAAALLVMLVDCIAITYFVGTSRWCKEVSETYHLAPRWTQEMNRLKRRTFPLATISMLVIVGVVALGGAADPAASLKLKAPAGLTWAQVHLAGALGGFVLVGWGYFLAWQNVEANQVLIGQVMEEVRRVRAARGLETETPVAQ